VRIQMISGTHVLLLRDAEEPRYLPIPIGPNEASAIAYHLQGVTPERPLTHDFALRAIRALGATLREVRITEIRRRNISCADADGCPKRRRGGA